MQLGQVQIAAYVVSHLLVCLVYNDAKNLESPFFFNDFFFVLCTFLKTCVYDCQAHVQSIKYGTLYTNVSHS